MRWKTVLSAGIMMLVLCAASYAHHGGAFFDGTKTFTLDGRVIELRFVNPHVIILFSAKNPETGEPQEWVAETFSASRLAQTGWNKNTFKVGDPITVVGNPARSRSKRLSILKVFRDGHEVVLKEHDEPGAY